MRVVYWFRRDLRTRDNRALAQAYSDADEVIALYVLNPLELAKKSPELRRKLLTLLLNSLIELDKEVKLHVYEGDPAETIEDISSRYKVSAVYTAKPLTWGERDQVKAVRDRCEKLGVRLVEVPDNTLVDTNEVEPGRTFDSFYKKWLKRVDTSITERVGSKKFIEVDASRAIEIYKKHSNEVDGKDALTPRWAYNRLRTFEFEKYGRLRNYPYLDSTSRLSTFINIGVLSIREVYNQALNRSSEFVRQLAWRDYYYTLGARYPWMKDLELKPYMRGFKWENNEYYIRSYMEGKTGYPIIDAGIRQLKSEGWIHNRVRLILASFLVKDLLVDWRVGEEFFRKYLLDYDEVLNTGNWQWAASTGVDPLPVRVFNPIKQAERYDPICYYIKTYIPELEGEDCRALQNPLVYRVKGYPEPIVDHYERSRYFLKLIKERL